MRIHQPFFLYFPMFIHFPIIFPSFSRPSRVTRTNLTVCRVDDNDRFGRDDRLHFDQLIRLGSAENSCPVVWYPQIYQKSVIKSAYKIDQNSHSKSEVYFLGFTADVWMKKSSGLTRVCMSVLTTSSQARAPVLKPGSCSG